MKKTIKITKNKSVLFVLFAMALVIFQSCADKINNNSGLEELNESSKEVAIDIQQEKMTLQYIESIYENGNSEFAQGEYVQSIPLKVKNQKVSTSEEQDTIRSADEIPVYKTEDINEKIFIDGTYKYQSFNTTPEDRKYFKDLNVEIQPTKEVVTKTIIKDGIIYLYNNNNEIIKTEQAGNINYIPMLDSIRSAVEADNQNTSSSQGVKAIQSKRIARAIRTATTSGMQLVSQNSNEIIMEMNLETTSKSSLPRKVKSSIQKKAIMRFSSDMSRMLEQKVFENNQLVQSVTYSYKEDDQNFSKKVSDRVRSFLPSSSVKGITYKSLMQKNNGTPYIVVRKENYKKNQVTINL